MVEYISKFGVPTGGSTGRGGFLMPKLKYRFRVRFINFGPVSGGLELTQQVMRVDKPKVSWEEVTMDAYNSRAYVLGKHSWETISCTLRDDATNVVSKIVGHQIQKQTNHMEQTAYAAGQNYKFNMYIETMDGGNDVVLEQWFVENCMVTNVSYGDLDYSGGADAQTIEMTIRYDNAVHMDGLFTEAPTMIPGTRA